MKKNFLALAVLAVIAVAATVTDANAVCATQKRFGSFDTDTATYTYVVATATATTSTIIGRFWQQGSYTSGNDGTYDDSIWMLPYAGGRFGISGAMASEGVVGCPAGRLNVLFQDTTNGQHFIASIFETPAAALWWNLTKTGGDMTLVSISRVKLGNRQVSGTTRTFDITTDPATGSAGDAGSTNQITGYRIMQQRKPTGQAAPGFSVSNGWVFVEQIAAGASRPAFNIDCSTPDQVYLAIQPSYDNGQFNSDIVGPITRVSCDPNLADPNSPNFKVIKKTSKVPTNKPNIE